MRSTFRVHIREQGGFVLITAIVLAILYFALMQLMLVESSRALTEAQRFRARIVSQTLAENGAELAAVQIVNRAGTNVSAENEQGTMEGTQRRDDLSFEITGKGTSAGVQPATATVRVQGTLGGGHLRVTYTFHSQ